MAGKKGVDKVSSGLTALIDEFTSSIKELVNAGEETVIHLAVGGGRVISALVDATGAVTKIGIETAENMVGSVAGGVLRVVKKTDVDKEEKE